MLGPPKDHRLIVNGLLWLTRTGAPWRDLPNQYGPWQTIAMPFYRWRRAGIWDRILADLQQHADADKARRLAIPLALLIMWSRPQAEAAAPHCRHRRSPATALRGYWRVTPTYWNDQGNGYDDNHHSGCGSGSCDLQGRRLRQHGDPQTPAAGTGSEAL